MNTKELLNVLKSKERIKHISSLLKDKKYDDIYSNYGQTIYNLVVPKKHKKSDINSLFAEGKFEDIYHKYGASTYNSLLSKMREAEVYYETGSKPKSIFHKIAYSIKHRIAPIFLSTTLLLPPSLGIAYHSLAKNDINENSITYAEDIEKYNNEIESYASEVRKLNLNDLQTIMKVMSDMWERIDGYAHPDETVLGYERLALFNNSVGDCEHMADDTTARLNAINPEYHARNLCVYMSPDQNFVLANIDRNIINNSDEVSAEESEETLGSKILNTSINFIGNHVVTAIDLPNENMTLILDPTNPSIGVFKNGKIHMFSTNDGTGLSPRPISNIIFKGDSVVDVSSDIVQTFLPTDKSIEELKEIYGPKALNDVLKEVEEIEKKYYQSSFDKKYKIDPDSLDKLDQNQTSSRNESETSRSQDSR